MERSLPEPEGRGGFVGSRRGLLCGSLSICSSSSSLTLTILTAMCFNVNVCMLL